MSVFKLLSKYRPEDKAAKKERLQQLAQTKASGGKEDAGKKPTVVKYGINHITALVEQKKAKLVVIAHDVDPIEIVVWLPALCQKFEVPYAIVKGKARLGKVVNKKTATAVALVDVKAEVRPALVRPQGQNPEPQLRCCAKPTAVSLLSGSYPQHCRTRAQDKAELTKVTEAVKASFNDRVGEIRKKWGGNIMGLKSNHKSSAKAKAIAREEAKRNQ